MKNNQIGPKGSRGDPPIASGSRGQPPWIFNDPWGELLGASLRTDCFVILPRNDDK